ncbi:MAG: hypothetical protein AB9866_00525 [Syntrophobacteraceae bacterium]
MDKDRGVISFAPCGALSPIDISLLAQHAGKLLSIQTEMLPALLQFPPHAFNSKRKQYHAGIVLNHLAIQHPDYLRVVGITPHDLFLPIFTHVYGEAQMPGRAAVISLFRLDSAEPDDSNLQNIFLRALKITIHELLHTFELSHCIHSECVMQPVTKISQLDLLSLKLCRSCTNFWEEVKHSLHIHHSPSAIDSAHQ